MSPLVLLSRILIPGRVNARTISLGKFLQIDKINENPDESFPTDYVYDSDPDDRSEIIDVDTSIRYIESEAFKETYGDKPVWVMYRRNQIGRGFKDTRISCIKLGQIRTGSPCPICRDKYLVVDYKNVKLLKQFISPHYGGLLPTMVTGICQRQNNNLRVAFLKAKEYGTISFDLPVRSYDYKYYEKLSKKNIC